MTRLQCGALTNTVRGVVGNEMESTVRYLGVDIDNAFDIAETIEV